MGRVMTGNPYINRIIVSVITPAVLKIRSQLLQEYPDTENFEGLCDESVRRLQDMLDFPVYVVHGEMRHSPILLSKYWCIEHTWAEIPWGNNEVIYVDPTCSQFKFLFPDIPDFYISTVKPPWFYADRENLAWNKKLNKLNEKIGFKGGSGLVRIIYLFQHRVWGLISDLIYYVRRR